MRQGRVASMNHFRGFLMLLAAGVAFFQGWKSHTGSHAVLAYALGVMALGLAVWHLTRKTPPRPV